MKLEGQRKPYTPKDTDEVRCDVHGVVTTWGALSDLGKMALESGLDTSADLPCLLAEDMRSSRRIAALQEEYDAIAALERGET